VTARPGDVVGRERELAAVSAFLDAIPDGPRALLLAGEPGIGKTTVWWEAVQAAHDRGYRVLQARPAESESRLSYAALADIVGAAFDETRATLPVPQERALAAMMLRDATEEPADARTTATALVSVLIALADESSILLAIDDVQWLDGASARALRFAARRLPRRLGLLVTQRTQGDADTPLGLDRALPEERFERVVVGPLSLAALRHVLSGRLQASLARPLLARIADASGGNPFYALEIARSLTGDAGADRPLPLPRGVQKMALARIRSLSPAAREAVLVVASLSRPTVATVIDALPNDTEALPAIVEAEEAGVLVTEHGRVRFTHPLLASAVYGSAPDARRRGLHRRLADVVTDLEERAHHLAQAVTEPDDETAATIETAARQATLRGAYDASAELFEAACRLTPAERQEDLAQRTLGQAFATLKAGDVASARVLAAGTVTERLRPALNAERFKLLAEVEWDDGATRLSTEFLERALVAGAGDRGLSAAILTRLVLVGMPADPAHALEHAERAMQLLSAEREPELLASILIDRFLAGVLLGRGARGELLHRGLQLEASSGPAAYPHPVPLIWFQCVDDVEATADRFAREDTWALERGDDRMRAERLGYLALVELQSGRWELAEDHAELGCATLEDIDVSGRFAYAFAWRSLIDAHRGRVERARTTLRPLVDEAARTEKAWWGAILLSVLGFVEFAAGNHQATDAALTRMRELLDGIGIREGLLDRTEPFHVASLVAMGKPDRAREMLVRLEERGRTIPRLWIDVALPRTRALVLAAEGELAAALNALDELDLAAAARMPFELGQTWLVKGRLHRRLKQRRLAADAFGEAATIFQGLGAPTWIEQASSDLARVRPRRRRQDELTATELRVAELAASGLTNRAVAQVTFMSAKTVESHLASVYRKLGIRSRAQLGASVGTLRQSGSAIT
jgi:DNA-binding CsgD family transcriptional regulator/DNA polymerase III delta prime subunit